MFLSLVSLALTVLATVIAIVEVNNLWRSRRTDEFNKVLKEIRNNRFEYSQLSLAKYRESGPADYECNHLIVMKGWELLENIPRTEKIIIQPNGCEGMAVYSSKHPNFETKTHDFPDSGTYSDNLIRNASKYIFDGKNYNVTSVRKDRDGMTISVNCSGYLDYVNTCEYRAYRTARCSLRGDEFDKDLFWKLDDYSNRSVGIGVNAMTVFTNVGGEHGKNLFLVHRRSDTVLEAPHMLSLVPAGSLQPTWKEYETLQEGKNVEKGDYIRKTIIREFEEEILNRAEVEFPYDYALSKESEKIDTYYLTMGFDPLTTKIEMVVLLVIDCTDTDEEFRKYLGIGGKGPMDEGDLKKLIEICSSEGEVLLKNLNIETVTRYENNMKAMPVFRECMRCIRILMDGDSP